MNAKVPELKFKETFVKDSSFVKFKEEQIFGICCKEFKQAVKENKITLLPVKEVHIKGHKHYLTFNLTMNEKDIRNCPYCKHLIGFFTSDDIRELKS